MSRFAEIVRDIPKGDKLDEEDVNEENPSSSTMPASSMGTTEPPASSQPNGDDSGKRTISRRQSNHTPIGEGYDDSLGNRFVRNESAFRGPLSAPSSPKTPPRSRAGRRNSWLGNPDNDGFFKRWVEEPLGFATAADPERPHTAETVGSPSGSVPDPQHQRQDPEPSRATSDDLTNGRQSKVSTWDATARRLGLKSNSEKRDSQEETDTFDESTDTHAPNARPSGARTATRRWGMIKNRFAPAAAANANNAGPPTASAAVSPDVNISDELLGGGLAALMLKLHFDRDEQDRRRVPVLLHHLKIRVSDSVRPMSGNTTAFRVECEYANGAARWVIYRELRDFITLHTHYKLSKIYGRADYDLPEFPLTSLPYFKWLEKQEGNIPHDQRRPAFARFQRVSLENYLVALIKGVMFRPEANRLAKFFEISALSIAMARAGGVQYKSGMLRILGGEASRRSVTTSFAVFGMGKAAKPRWWMVRESYLVSVDDPGDTEIFDVFLVDGDFAIERPKRYYRKLDPTRFSHKDDQDQDQDDEHHSEDPDAGDPIGDPNQDPIHLESHGPLAHFAGMFHIGHHDHSEQRRSEDTHRGRRSVEGKDQGDEAEKKADGHHASFLDGDPSTQPTQLDKDAAEAISASRAVQSLSQTSSSRKKKATDVSQHTFFLQNSQRKLKFVAKNERQLNQWILSIERMSSKSHWTGGNRFDSFAPIRLNVSAQWLVDGRDYFWNLSRAISLAKEKIYIHDWWLSPELQLRRPDKMRYRVDQLLKRKAEEGVKIFVIVYKEVSNRTTPTDSNYTKQRLVSLHPNIMVQRSPGHYATGTFFWAHHEKLCVIDEAVAFMGGLDMCFGRWDTPQHALVDDPEDQKDQIWPGKDYSNERVLEFHTLNKPFEDMYDRTKVPRMPWHDVSMQIVGQPARDLCRHFVQRWNYLLRIKTHSRIMPFLLPPAPFNGQVLEDQRLNGTREVQICRSAGNWSMGFQHRVEHSIQNAYLKAIQMSEHFVYIENQFFITSTVVSDIKIENQIGDALVSRILRAHKEGTQWRACISSELAISGLLAVETTSHSASESA